MTLKELKERAESTGLQYAYDHFDSEIDPPHLIGRILGSDYFLADNKVYFKIHDAQLELTTLIKDIEKEYLVENNILHDVVYSKEETYIESEMIYNVSYFFNIKEE